jgi:hypothetical protein
VTGISGSIGIGQGVNSTARTTDRGFDLPYVGYRKRCAGELAKAQRKMARRRTSGSTSGGYRRARRAAATLHRRAANQNTYAGRTWATSVVDNHHVIAVQDFEPKILATFTMARKGQDAAIGAAKRGLIERGVRAGRTVVLVAPVYATITCSGCTWSNTTRCGLGVRTFRCQACGCEPGRDRNAARTILATGERIRAVSDDIRHPLLPSKDVVGAVRVRNPLAVAHREPLTPGLSTCGWVGSAGSPMRRGREPGLVRTWLSFAAFWLRADVAVSLGLAGWHDGAEAAGAVPASEPRPVGCVRRRGSVAGSGVRKRR